MGVAVAILYYGRLFFITAMLAMMIAFILEPFVALLMRIRFPRSLASFVVCTIALSVLYVIGLGAYSQLAAIYVDLPKYGERIADIVDGVRQRIEGTDGKSGTWLRTLVTRDENCRFAILNTDDRGSQPNFDRREGGFRHRYSRSSRNGSNSCRSKSEPVRSKTSSDGCVPSWTTPPLRSKAVGQARPPRRFLQD